MDKIFKYTLERQEHQAVHMPQGAELLSVGMQDGEIRLWAKVCPVAPYCHVDIFVRGTGHDFTGAEWRFIGTVFDGPFVWHIFEGSRT